MKEQTYLKAAIIYWAFAKISKDEVGEFFYYIYIREWLEQF